MKNPPVGPFIVRILLRALVYELVVFAVIGGIAYWRKWFDTNPFHYDWFGNSFFIAGIFVLIFAGFTVSGVRQMPQGQGAFIAMQSIGTMSDGNPEAHRRFLGIVAFLHANKTTIGLALAGIVALICGVILQSLMK
jgi:hypothetical protein